MGGAAHAASHTKEVKIGFVTTLTTGAAVIGNDMKKAVELALEHRNAMAGDHT
ncbi:MAG: ABC transporter substrate-binding protein, partial [Alphaproteobacteria bacterium]